MRRRLVEDGRVPASLQKALAGVEKRGNPYGKMPRKRGDWIKDREGEDAPVRVLKKGEETDTLFFTDSCTAYDPRIQQIGRAFARVLSAAGVEVGTLGKDEVDAGHEVRRAGEEGLFEVLREKNVEALKARDFERVVTNDPHAWNALRCDGYGLEQPVFHHSEIMARFLVEGKLKLRPAADDRVYVFHDPCYPAGGAGSSTRPVRCSPRSA